MRATNRLTYIVCAMIALLADARTLSSDSSPKCPTGGEAELTMRLDAWEQAFNTGDSEALAAAYPRDAILMGLGEPAIVMGQAEIARHYSDLLETRPVVKRRTSKIDVACDQAVAVGIQDIAYQTATGAQSYDILYRMTFLRERGVWELIHHHLETVRGTFAMPPSRQDALSGIVTGGVPLTVARDEITLPQPTFALPRTPPVFLYPRLPDALTRRHVAVQAALPAAPTPTLAIPTLAIPPLAIDVGSFPSPAQPARSLAVVVPPLGIDVGVLPALPFVPPSQAIEVPPSFASAVAFAIAPDYGSAEPEAPATSTPDAPRAPAVAGFSQRAAEAAPPPVVPPSPAATAILGAKPKSTPKAATARAKTASPKVAETAPPPSKYRPVNRWNETLPQFDD